MMEIAFWICFALVAYTYGGYHLLIFATGRRRGVRSGDAGLSVTAVIAMRDEADAAGRVLNLLEQDCPELDVIVVLDGTGDKAENELNQLAESRLTVLTRESRSGKAACLNHALTHATGDIVVFGDARQRFETDAVRRLVESFADPKVGAVSGELEIRDAKGGAGSGVGAYWRLEKKLRQAEAQSDSCIGCTGAIYAIRRELYEELPEDTILDDVVVPMQIAVAGYRVLFESQAIAFDPQASQPTHEMRRKVRTLAGNYQMLFRRFSWIFPWRNRLWWQLISHKYMRLAAPYLMLAVLVLNGCLFETASIYQATLYAQTAAYGLAVIGLLLPGLRVRLLTVPAGFLLLNAASAASLWAYLFVDYQKGWGSGATDV